MVLLMAIQVCDQAGCTCLYVSQYINTLVKLDVFLVRTSIIWKFHTTLQTVTKEMNRSK